MNFSKKFYSWFLINIDRGEGYWFDKPEGSQLAIVAIFDTHWFDWRLELEERRPRSQSVVAEHRGVVTHRQLLLSLVAVECLDVHVADAALSADLTFGILLSEFELKFHIASLVCGSGRQRCGNLVGWEGGDVADTFLDLSVGNEVAWEVTYVVSCGFLDSAFDWSRDWDKVDGQFFVRSVVDPIERWSNAAETAQIVTDTLFLLSEDSLLASSDLMLRIIFIVVRELSMSSPELSSLWSWSFVSIANSRRFALNMYWVLQGEAHVSRSRL